MKKSILASLIALAAFRSLGSGSKCRLGLWLRPLLQWRLPWVR
jgi:hypothetical protein